jgi:hypothetical protein
VLRRWARHGHTHPARLAVFALLALAGCGGGESDDGYAPGVSRPLDKVQFLAEADRICHSTNAQIEAAADDLVGGRHDPPPAQVRRVVLAVAIPALEAEVRAIRAIGVPAGDAKEVDAIIAATERGIAELRADPAIAVNGAPPGLRAAARLSRAYGSQECGLR